MEFYSHQAQQPQQQSAQQQADSMASISSSTTTTNSNSATTTVGGASSSSSNNISNNNNIISSSTTPPTSSSASSTTSVVTADAATVAIAKDMLQLHHGGAAHNSSSSMNATSSIIAASASSSSSSPSPSATTTNTTSPPAHASNAAAGLPPPPDNALGYLKYDQDLLYITEPCTIIGRNSSSSHVHFHVAENNLVSRKHFQVHFDSDTRDFYVQCLSKNGIFVDDFLQRRNADPFKLLASCYFRFPSTEIRIQFESFSHASPSNAVSSSSSGTLLNNSHNALAMHHNSASTTNAGMIGNPTSSSSGTHVIISAAPTDESHLHHHHQHQQQIALSSSAMTGSSHLVPMDSTNVIYSPLKITIPKKEQKSPYLSPTGTISAANSCPASPRQGYYQNQANNYGNNNLQSEDLFQPPSQSEKPPYSYAQLIVQAISAAPDKQLTLSGIYSFIVKHYPYYRKEINKGWQNSIRHNLSLNRYFIKVARSQDEPGKGSFWRIDPDSGAKLIDHSYKKRRQRSSQGFRPSYGMPRSAPVSPSHMDNSRESSPVQDIVLQSAPGSPGMSMENRTVEDLMYNSQNMHQSTANNSHNQYNSGSPYCISNQNSVVEQHTVGGGSGGNNVGALIALKRNHAMAANAAMGHQQQQQQQQQQTQQQQSLHPDIIYEDMPTDYSGNMESGDECDGAAAKRSKYISEVL